MVGPGVRDQERPGRLPRPAVAGVEGSKVFPHNLRHMFAVAFYRGCHDIVKLAGVLGHSSIETTRIYVMATWGEHSRQMDRLGLVL